MISQLICSIQTTQGLFITTGSTRKSKIIESLKIKLFNSQQFKRGGTAPILDARPIKNLKKNNVNNEMKLFETK